MIDPSVPGTADWWLHRLATRLGESFPRLRTLRDRYQGTEPVPDGGAETMRDAYRRFKDLARLNVASLVVEAVTSRLQPDGFRSAGDDDADGDDGATARWERHHMAVQARDLFTDMAVYGSGFALVDDETGAISTLDPWLTVVEPVRGSPSRPRAALTAGWDPVDGADRLIVFWEDDRVWARSAIRRGKVSCVPDSGAKWLPGKTWEWEEDARPVGLSQVPVVPFVAKGGLGQFERHLASLDRINHTIFQRLSITVMQAFRQRWISGDLPDLYPEGHPKAGQKIDYEAIFRAGPAAMWRLPPGTKVEESAYTDVTPLLTAVKDELKQLASVSQTPLYILDPEAAMGSAAGASASRETLVFKVEDFQARAGDSLVAAMALSFEATGERSDGLRVVWAPADRASLSEKAQAASQAKDSLPRRMVWRKIWQLTPAEMAQAEQDAADEAFEGGDDGQPRQAE
ncbi:MAG: phage portal protein [Propionibacteriaceae bacterium]|jgi:hypothetical protein|nr:phage portal protein [Propionibacteriaceae bacterium]